MNAEQVSDRLLEFAVQAGRVVDALPDTRMGRHIAGQLIRCATSPLPNYGESCAAESKPDFIHKLSMCHKELRESRVWLRLIVRSRLLTPEQMVDLTNECDQLCRIFAQSLITAKRNQTRSAGQSGRI